MACNHYPITGGHMMELFPEGINIVENVNLKEGVETLEGRIGPLLTGEYGQCHYIEMHPGMYCNEHPHPTESLIFTARGQWVLCSRGKRFHMKPGSLFWFGKDVPTGYEVPFDEDVFLVIFKSRKPEESSGDMLDYLRGLQSRLEQRNGEGEPFTFRELPSDHPAVIFAETMKDKNRRETAL